MTYGELIYICADLSRSLSSDDSKLNESHIKFLLSKHRAHLLYEKYKAGKESIPQSNYQTICIDLILDNSNPCDGILLKSEKSIPNLMSIGTVSISPSGNLYSNNISWVNNEMFRYVGENKFTKNLIYATLATDNHIHLKSSNLQFQYLKKVVLNGVFEDIDNASELSCDTEGNLCNPLEQEFKLENSLVPALIQIVVQELSGVKFQPYDKSNNASDDLSDIMSYIRQNAKSPLQKQIES